MALCLSVSEKSTRGREVLTDTFLSPPDTPGRTTGRIRHHLLILLHSARLSLACITIAFLQSDIQHLN